MGTIVKAARYGKVIYTGPAAELAKDEERVRAMAGASAEEWSLPG